MPGSSTGLIRGGVAWNEVCLHRGRGAGERCAIFLSQDATSTARWDFRVQVFFDEGSIDIGAFQCEPPGIGVLPSRLVAIANCPGAIGWSVSAHCEDVNETADCWLASSPDSSGGDIGVTVVRGGSRDPNAIRGFVDGHAVQAPVQLSGPGAQLWQIEGDLQEIAAANQGTVVMLFDQAVAPALNDAPIYSKHLGQNGVNDPSDGSHYLYNPDEHFGRTIKFALWIAVSSTGGLFTQDVNHHVDFHMDVSVP